MTYAKVRKESIIVQYNNSHQKRSRAMMLDSEEEDLELNVEGDFPSASSPSSSSLSDEIDGGHFSSEKEDIYSDDESDSSLNLPSAASLFGPLPASWTIDEVSHHFTCVPLTFICTIIYHALGGFALCSCFTPLKPVPARRARGHPPPRTSPFPCSGTPTPPTGTAIAQSSHWQS